MFIGIDLGTTNLKAVLVDEAQHVVAEASVPLGTSRPQAGWSEQSPDDWIEAAKGALLGLREKASSAYSATLAIGFSGQMHGLVALDAADRPLRPCILHNDGRAAAEAAEIEATFPHLSQVTGVLCMPSFVAPKLLWLKRNEPGIAAGLAQMLMPKDYLRLWFCGRRSTDMVDAAGAWLLDEKARGWSVAALEATGFDAAILPALDESIAAAGNIRPEVAEDLGLPRKTLIVSGAGDAAAGSIGLGQIAEGDAFISLGTASQIFVTTNAYRASVNTLIHAFAHAAPGLWFQMAAMLNGAAALAWWAGICGTEPGALIGEAEKEGRAGEALFLPYLAGERTPHNNPAARGTFHGLGAGATRADMTRAVLDGVAFTLADARDALAEGGSSIGELGIAGGGAKSDFWCSLIADALDRPILRYADAAIGPAFGAARLARLAFGFEPLEAVCTKPKIERAFTPSARAVEANISRIARWRQTYRALAS
jgi:xylulokinase